MEAPFFSLLVLASLLGFAILGVQASVKRTETLHPKYKVEWQTNADDTAVEFALTVETSGFVGFGLSLSGKMPGGDMVVGGVYPNSTTYFKVIAF
jgi:hypothetical protein